MGRILAGQYFLISQFAAVPEYDFVRTSAKRQFTKSPSLDLGKAAFRLTERMHDNDGRHGQNRTGFDACNKGIDDLLCHGKISK